ncbi:MAG: M48 family metallopeptidase [Candidatus Paceibacterota bacterium]
MQTLYTHEDSNIRKTWLLITLFLVIVIALGWFFSYYFSSPDILYFAVIFAFFQVFFSYWFSHKIVLSMSGAREVKREEHRDLWNIVENLAITAGLPMPKLYIINDQAPNAFATGRNKKHAVVAVTTGLLERLDKTELEGVIAHELSHIGNRDMLVSTLVVVLVGFITLLSDMFLRAQIFGGNNRGNDRSGGGQVQLILVVVGIVLMILSPIIATLIQLSISRKREFLADATGALLTRYPEGLASALEKISASSVKMKKANHATAHLFISNPFGKEKSQTWFQNLWSTHPPVEERVKRLRSSD